MSRALFDAERALPPIWNPDTGFNDARVRFYTSLTAVSHPLWDRRTTAEWVATMWLETGLDNGAIGNNYHHPTSFVPEAIAASWISLDSYHHLLSLDDLHRFRLNPLAPLQHALETPDLIRVGTVALHPQWHRWNAHDDRIDPADPDAFNPLAWCLDVYDQEIPAAGEPSGLAPDTPTQP